MLHILVEDGTYDDAWPCGTELDEELFDWSRGIFRYRGQQLSLRWLNDEQPAALRREIGLEEQRR